MIGKTFIPSFLLICINVFLPFCYTKAMEKNYHSTDTISDRVKEHILQSAIQDGLNENSIKLSIENIDNILLADKLLKAQSSSLNANGKLIKQDENGNTTKISKDIFDNLIIENSNGNLTKIRKDIHNNLILEDSKGERTTIRKDIFNNLIIENDRGNRTTVKKDIFDNLTIEDNLGNRTKVRKNIFGNYEATDNKGNKASIKKDIFGKIIINDPNNILDLLKLQLIEEMLEQ